MLWKRFIKDRTDTNYASYKLQRNRCTSLRRKAIRYFFAKRSEAENRRDFWNVYRPFLVSKKHQHPNDIILKEHDVVIKDKTEIANVFNDYFVSNARDLNEITGNYAEDFAKAPIQV